jgi:uncharacterized glyoxalase superfamily protein PhnB
MSTAERQTVFLAPRYKDAWAAISFLERCFGFERQAVHEGADGTVAHAELRLGVASVGLSSAAGPVLASNPWTSVRSGMYVALPDAADVDAHHARAHAAGAVIAMPLEDTDYGSRQYSVWDHAERLWCFGTYNHAPTGEPALFVVLRYPDRAEAAEWLARAFGFEPVALSGPQTVASEQIELRLGESPLWLSDRFAGDRSGGDWHVTHVVVPDVETHYASARRAGVTIVQPLADGVYYARDPEGYLWSFGSRPPGRQHA